MSSVPVQDDTEQLLEIFNTADSGPSPWGISTHSDWAECGRRAYLRAAEKAAKLETPEEDAPDATGLSALRVGIYAHKLFEGRIKRQLGTDLIWDARASTFNESFLEAVRLYRNYHLHWGSIEERWGCKVIGAEVSLGGPAIAEAVKGTLGGYLTGRADCIIEITDPAKALASTGLVLMPGRYLFDLKTGKAHSSGDAAKYGDGLQAKAYLWLDAVERGEESALGIVFDRVISHKEMAKNKSYAGYVAYPDIFAEEKLRALVRLSMRSQAEPLPNPNACAGQFGRPCWFKFNGTCQGY